MVFKVLIIQGKGFALVYKIFVVNVFLCICQQPDKSDLHFFFGGGGGGSQIGEKIPEGGEGSKVWEHHNSTKSLLHEIESVDMIDWDLQETWECQIMAVRRFIRPFITASLHERSVFVVYISHSRWMQNFIFYHFCRTWNTQLLYFFRVF